MPQKLRLLPATKEPIAKKKGRDFIIPQHTFCQIFESKISQGQCYWYIKNQCRCDVRLCQRLWWRRMGLLSQSQKQKTVFFTWKDSVNTAALNTESKRLQDIFHRNNPVQKSQPINPRSAQEKPWTKEKRRS